MDSRWRSTSFFRFRPARNRGSNKGRRFTLGQLAERAVRTLGAQFVQLREQLVVKSLPALRFRLLEGFNLLVALADLGLNKEATLHGHLAIAGVHISSTQRNMPIERLPFAKKKKCASAIEIDTRIPIWRETNPQSA